MPTSTPRPPLTLWAESGGADSPSIDDAQLQGFVDRVAEEWVLADGVKRLLLVPPDHTRLHSFAGPITAMLWRRLHTQVHIDILPALGTHKPMTPEQLRMMFGDGVPLDRFVPHDWRNDLQPLGTVPAARLAELSGGRFERPIEVAVNRRIVSGAYDRVLSIGQVVPHEVIGFANYTKNICIGCGGGELLHASHFLGAVAGIEDVLGRVDTPVRRLIDGAFDEFVRPRADVRFVLTVVADGGDQPTLRAVTASAGPEAFRWAADRSAELNLTRVDRPIDRCVVTLDPREFTSTWLGNKAVYRTRKAMADGGELIVLAPAVDTFGEDEAIDRLIRRHGYAGTPATLAALDRDPELASNLSAAAHLIHGSSEGRFRVVYCTDGSRGLTAAEVRSVGYEHLPYADTAAAFELDGLTDGWHTAGDGKPFYFIRNPALGLWTG